MNNHKIHAVKTVLIKVNGIVQGVGFRPFVHRLAMKYGINGSVRNTSGNVIIEAEAGPSAIRSFITAIKKGKPPASRIFSIRITKKNKNIHSRGFKVVKSVYSGDVKLVPPDLKACDECIDEFNDPNDRRYHYPFINCTNCGPRFTIIKDTPYDRPNTAMSGFKMCPECKKEYKDINNRRYHAEPNACPACGPKVWLADAKGRVIEQSNEKVFAKARSLLKKGAIIAVKGLGGFHMAADAANKTAVLLLKKRKRRSNKPLAVMADSIETVRKFAVCDRHTESLLLSPEAPVVLLQNKKNNAISLNAAPGLKHTGWFLPYTPLHRLLFDNDFGAEPVRRSHGAGGSSISTKRIKALIMTSANIAEEPIQHDNKQAIKALKGLVDYFIFHDRPINIPADDSVIKACEAQSLKFNGQNNPSYVIIRRSRGYVPVPFPLNIRSPDIMATGALLKNSMCFIKDGSAFMSQHIGDLENRRAYEYFIATADNFMKFYGIKPAIIACDMHPDYLSTRYAEEFAARQNILFVKVQHHYAHMLSVMAEHGHKGKAIGIIMDGAGLGSDGKTWGGEFLTGDFNGYKREAHLKYIALPGGDLASKQAYRAAISVLSGFVDHGEIRDFYKNFNAPEILTMLKTGINTPLSSGAGRLFDAAASILGICHVSTYDAEAPMKLEAAATGVKPEGAYGYKIYGDNEGRVLDMEDCFKQLWKNRKKKTAAADFHLTFASALHDTATLISKDTGIKDVVLSGGVFQNTVLLQALLKKLQNGGFNVLIHRKLSPNDSSIALGQAVYAANLFNNAGRQSPDANRKGMIPHCRPANGDRRSAK